MQGAVVIKVTCSTGRSRIIAESIIQVNCVLKGPAHEHFFLPQCTTLLIYLNVWLEYLRRRSRPMLSMEPTTIRTTNLRGQSSSGFPAQSFSDENEPTTWRAHQTK